MKTTTTTLMKTTTTLLAGALWLGAILCGVAQEQSPPKPLAGAPKIKFDRTVYDFGKTSQVETVTGVFKFTNVGNAVLKLEPPKPTCGCTVVELKPDTLQPGESGELPFTLHLGQVKALFEKSIGIRSNDPLTPDVALTVKADYTPLYDVNPLTLAPRLAFGVKDEVQFTTITRTDGKPIQIGKLVASKPWITATVEPAAKTNEAAARIRIVVQRDGTPRRFNEYIHVYAADRTNAPVSSIYVYGQIMGEVSLTPEALYWSVTDAKTAVPDRPEAMVVRRVTVSSATGKAFELKNPQSTLKGLKVELVPKEAGKVYELVARLDEVPASTVSGNVSFETSVAAQSRIEVPVIVHVFKP
jgi:hypothetical protein